MPARVQWLTSWVVIRATKDEGEVAKEREQKAWKYSVARKSLSNQCHRRIEIHWYLHENSLVSTNIRQYLRLVPWMLWFLVSICPCDDVVSQDGSVDRWEVPGSDTWLERTSHQRSAKSCSSLVFGALLLVVTHVDSELYSCSWSCCIGWWQLVLLKLFAFSS